MREMMDLAALLLITFFFYILRSHFWIFTMISLCIVAAFNLWATVLPGEKYLITVGLILYWFGLVITRVILVRSVSLLLLQRLMTGEMAANVEEEIASRIEDAARFRLTRTNADGSLRLAVFGKSVSVFVRLLYFLTRQTP